MSKKSKFIVSGAVAAIVISALALTIKIDRDIPINCIGKTRDEVLAMMADWPRVRRKGGKMMIMIGDAWGHAYFDDIEQIKADSSFMALPEWRVFESDIHISFFAGRKYLRVEFNAEGIVIDQEVRNYFDGL